MNKKPSKGYLKISISIIIILIFLLNTSINVIGEKIIKKPTIEIDDDPFSLLETGDILLIYEPRYEKGILTLSYWSHCLLYVGNDEFIDATGRLGVSRSPVEKTKARTDVDNFAILSVKGDYDVSKVVSFVEDKIGYPYDFRALMSPQKQINASKSEYGYGYTCTELIWAAYLDGVNINLDSNNRGWMTLWEMYTNKNVEVKYVQKPEKVVLKGFEIIFNLFTCYI